MTVVNAVVTVRSHKMQSIIGLAGGRAETAEPSGTNSCVTEGGQMDDEQRRFLWKTYRDEQKAGGPARDRLPYTQHFVNILDRFNTQYGTSLTHHDVWGALSDLDKAPERRRQLGCVD